jgi:hypothetical protein
VAETAPTGIVLADAAAAGIGIEADRPVDKARFKREVFRFPA